MNIIIPMAGLGSRFFKAGYDEPKPLIKLDKKFLIEHAVESLKLQGNYIFITRKYDNENYNEILSNVIKRLKPDATEIKISNNTNGATETALLAREIINNDEELVITNCDQLLNWNHLKFLDHVGKEEVDGCVVTYKSADDKNSFAEIKDEKVVRVAEKVPISCNALVGVHYWKKGSDFVSSAEELLSKFNTLNLKETYISETYNFLIAKNKKIIHYSLDSNCFFPLGTPEDLTIALGKLKEFYTLKPKTIFCDIDGTILKHKHSFSEAILNEPEPLENVIKKFNEWDSQGHKLILVTARKESARSITEKHLTSLGICWDHLIMGVTSGTRVIVNDKLNKNDNDRAIAINVVTDEGFSSIDWSYFDL